MTPARVSIPLRTARPLRGHTSPTWPAGISTWRPVATAARAPGESTTDSRARRSAPAAPSDAYSGSVPAPSTLTSTATRGLYFQHAGQAEPLRARPRRPRGRDGGARRAGLPRAPAVRLALPPPRPRPGRDDRPREAIASSPRVRVRGPLAGGGRP